MLKKQIRTAAARFTSLLLILGIVTLAACSGNQISEAELAAAQSERNNAQNERNNAQADLKRANEDKSETEAELALIRTQASACVASLEDPSLPANDILTKNCLESQVSAQIIAPISKIFAITETQNTTLKQRLETSENSEKAAREETAAKQKELDRIQEVLQKANLASLDSSADISEQVQNIVQQNIKGDAALMDASSTLTERTVDTVALRAEITKEVEAKLASEAREREVSYEERRSLLDQQQAETTQEFASLREQQRQFEQERENFKDTVHQAVLEDTKEEREKLAAENRRYKAQTDAANARAQQAQQQATEATAEADRIKTEATAEADRIKEEYTTKLRELRAEEAKLEGRKAGYQTECSDAWNVLKARTIDLGGSSSWKEATMQEVAIKDAYIQQAWDDFNRVCVVLR